MTIQAEAPYDINAETAAYHTRTAMEYLIKRCTPISKLALGDRIEFEFGDHFVLVEDARIVDRQLFGELSTFSVAWLSDGEWVFADHVEESRVLQRLPFVPLSNEDAKSLSKAIENDDGYVLEPDIDVSRVIAACQIGPTRSGLRCPWVDCSDVHIAIVAVDDSTWLECEKGHSFTVHDA